MSRSDIEKWKEEEEKKDLQDRSDEYKVTFMLSYTFGEIEEAWDRLELKYDYLKYKLYNNITYS